MDLKKFFSNKTTIKHFKESLTRKKTLTSKTLLNAFFKTIKTESKNVRKAAVLFSGGLDSSLIAFALKKHIKKLVLVTVGFKNSNALKESRKGATLLGLKLIEHEITREELKECIPIVKKIIKTNDFLQLQIALPEFIALKTAKAKGFNIVFVGQGADELFYGYNSFRLNFNDKNPEFLDNLAWKKLESYWKENLERDLLLAAYFKVKLKAPYLNKDFIEKAMLLPVKEKIKGKNDFLRKHALRRLAVSVGLPRKLALKKKKAIQYDTNVSKELKKILKK